MQGSGAAAGTSNSQYTVQPGDTVSELAAGLVQLENKGKHLNREEWAQAIDRKRREIEDLNSNNINGC